MGKRSQSRTRWPQRQTTDAPARTLRVYVCADCKARGVQLVNCADGRQRCPTCKAGFERLAVQTSARAVERS